MKVVVTIFAVLLLLLSGGCTLVFVFMGIPASIDFAQHGEPLWNEVIPLWLFLGLLPLVLGILILRAQRRGRESSITADSEVKANKPDEPPEPPEEGGAS